MACKTLDIWILSKECWKAVGDMIYFKKIALAALWK
jgi:hypothetical protein